MSGDTQAGLIRMANDIARNMAAQGEEAAIAATARHISDFWAPGMKAAILKGDRAGLHPIAAAAIERIACAHLASPPAGGKGLSALPRPGPGLDR